MTAAEIVAAWAARRISYIDAYHALAYAGVRDVRRTLAEADQQPATPTPNAPDRGWLR